MKFRALFATAVMSVSATIAVPALSLAQDQVSQSQNEAQDVRYIVTDLGVVGGPPGQPFHITNNGLIAGAAATGKAEHAVLWVLGFKLDIGTPALGGPNSVSFGMNQWGQAVGEADTSVADDEDFCGFAFLGFRSGTRCLPFVWQDGVMSPLPLLKDKNGVAGNNGVANVIDRWGTAVGISENTTLDSTCPPYDPSLGQSQKYQMKPVSWYDGQVRELPTIGGDPDGVAFAISDYGLIAGASGTCSGFSPISLTNIQPVHAVLWEHGKATDLGTLGADTGNSAAGINNRGDVVGSSAVNQSTFYAFLWTKEQGKMQALKPFDTDVLSTATAINDRREVVGVSLDANFNPRAVLWVRGVPIDLNTRVSDASGLYLITACGITDRGEIIGIAQDKKGAYHGYLATPKEKCEHSDYRKNSK